MKTVILIFAYATICFGKSPEPPVQPTMHKIFENMKELLPYMISEEKFSDAKNNKFIGSHLKEMASLAKNAKHTKELKTTTLKISQEVLENHFSEIERVFRLGNKSYARWQLSSTVPICMSCHTQSPSKSRHWDLADLTRGNIGDFEKAELLFMGRDFDSAQKYYDLVINGYPGNKMSLQNVEKSFERKIVIYSRVTRNFKEGIMSLEKSLKNKNFPDYLQKNIKAWTALFRIQQREGFPNPLKSNDDAIKKYVEKELKNGLWDDMVQASNPRLVKNLTLSGILYEYLNSHPDSKIKPDILNWLAICDRKLQETLFYSLADLYLKECMRDFSKHPTAKKCFEQYKDNAVSSYSGSGGINLPEDVKRELRDWSMKIYGTDESAVEE